MSELKNKNWPNFIERLLEISDIKNLDVENLGTGVEIEENDLLIDTITNLQIFKQFFSTLYKVIGDNLLEVFVNTPMQYKEAIDRDILNNCCFFLILKNF